MTLNKSMALNVSTMAPYKIIMAYSALFRSSSFMTDIFLYLEEHFNTDLEDRPISENPFSQRSASMATSASCWTSTDQQIISISVASHTDFTFSFQVHTLMS